MLMLMLMTETRSTRRRLSWLLAAAVLLSVATMAPRPVALEVPLEAQGRGGGRGQDGPPPEPPTGRGLAPVDLTGYWVSIVTEDWRWRMLTPPKGDYSSLPLTAEARKVADGWDAARDTAAGEQCRAYGAAAIMRVPGRIHITWESDSTLRVDTEAGTQTRLFRFGADAGASPAGAGSWQGHSAAEWEIVGGRRGEPVRGGSLKVVTTGMRPGYLRRNGVPYSANAVVTEYYHAARHANGDAWLFVTTVVEDPQYLNARFVTSSHFKKAADGATWNPTPCEAG
jgi:hypothetical protein